MPQCQHAKSGSVGAWKQPSRNKRSSSWFQHRRSRMQLRTWRDYDEHGLKPWSSTDHSDLYQYLILNSLFPISGFTFLTLRFPPFGTLFSNFGYTEALHGFALELIYSLVVSRLYTAYVSHFSSCLAQVLLRALQDSRIPPNFLHTRASSSFSAAIYSLFATWHYTNKTLLVWRCAAVGHFLCDAFQTTSHHVLVHCPPWPITLWRDLALWPE